MSTFRNGRVLAAVAALSLACLVGAAGPADAQTGSSGKDRKEKRQQFLDGVSVPVVSTPNIRFVGNFPDTAAISGVHAISAPYFYVSSTDSINVYDTSDPVHPRLTGTLPNLVFENEAMNYGEQTIDGVINRFVLVGVDAVEFSPTDPSHVATGNEVMVVDVTDPANPRIRSRAKTTTNTHTVSCIQETSCRYAYTAGRNGKVSIVDLTDLDAPRELSVFSSPAGGPNAAFTSGAGHKWNFDNAGYGVHTGSGGSAIFDVSDPTSPTLVASTDENGVKGPWNDFIHHNSARPNASAFRAGATPSVKNGNVLLVTEEDYENTDCVTAGSFQTWYVDQLGTPGTIRPLDRINPVDLGEGVAAPHMAFCSAHWFDYHQSGHRRPGLLRGRAAADRRTRPQQHHGVRLLRQRPVGGVGRLLVPPAQQAGRRHREQDQHRLHGRRGAGSRRLHRRPARDHVHAAARLGRRPGRDARSRDHRDPAPGPDRSRRGPPAPPRRARPA